MLTQDQISQIKKSLKNSKNPLFFFDDDPDGICSYLLLKKYIKKGKPVVVKATPTLDISLFRKVEEKNPDHIFVLDIPEISQEFIDQASRPITWIDHHPLQERKNVNYFNPKQNNPKSTLSTSEICYQITQENLWIATLGAVADWQIPSFLEDFKKEYPSIINTDSTNPADLNYDTDLEKIIKLFLFILKNPTTEIYRSISILEKVGSPHELINQTTPRAKYLFKKIRPVENAYERILEQARKSKIENGILLFHYPSQKWSFTTELSNELQATTNAEVIIVAREKDNNIKMSIRSKEIPINKAIKKAIENLQATGGGHKLACGATVNKDQFKEFLEIFIEEINRKRYKQTS